MSSFEVHFRNLSDFKLVRILEESENYEQEAVVAARLELERRQLPDEDYERVRERIRKEKEKKNRQKEGIKAAKAIAEIGLEEAGRLLHPMEHKSTRTILKIIAGYLILSALFAIFSQLGYLTLMITESAFSPVELLSILVIPMLELIGGILLWVRRKYGWVLVVASSTFTAIFSAANISMLLRYTFRRRSENLEGLIIDIVDLTDLPGYNLEMQVIWLLLFGGIVFYLFSKKVRSIFNVSQSEQWLTLSIPALIALAIILGY